MALSEYARVNPQRCPRSGVKRRALTMALNEYARVNPQKGPKLGYKEISSSYGVE
jgi:hypothetical protein